MNAPSPHPNSVSEIARILAATDGALPVPSRSDRAAWQRLARQSIATEVTRKAEEAARAPVPSLPLSLYLDYHRTGRRAGYEEPLDARRDRLTWLALAECLEGRGRFIDPVQDMLDAILSEPTWVVPAHGAEFTDGLPMPGLQVIDLWSAMACLLVAEVDHMLGDALHTVLRARIRRAVDERGTAPLLARDDMRWMGATETGRSSPNWAPVCAGLTAGAALYLESDRGRLAAVVAKALRELDCYLASFPADGGCAEGVGYWEKGVFAYACFAELLAARTEGRLDPMQAPRLRTIAEFPARVQIGPQRYPVFSDNVASRTVQTSLLRHLARRLDLPALYALDPSGEADRRHTTRYPAEQIRDFLWWHPAGPAPTPAQRDWLHDTQILVARLDPTDPDALTLAAKGGTNGEPHNHNDVGSFVIALGGGTPIAEIGAGIYDRAAFDPALRYLLPNYGSHGHSVPLVNGTPQSAGAGCAAGDVRCEGDSLTMDLTACYPAAQGLQRLVRTIRLDRAGARIVLQDSARFAPAGRLASVLMTQEAPERLGSGVVALGPLMVEYDPSLDLKIEPLDPVRTRDGRTECFTRLILSPPQRGPECTIAVTLHPRSPPNGASR